MSVTAVASRKVRTLSGVARTARLWACKRQKELIFAERGEFRCKRGLAVFVEASAPAVAAQLWPDCRKRCGWP